MTENPFQIFVDLGNRWPVLGEAYFYAIGAPAVIILFFFGRFWLRSMVNKRVRSIGVDGEAFVSLDQMRKKGLITEEEYKAARRKAAEKQLASMTAEPAGGKNPFEVLQAIEANPELAKTLLQPVDERVRKSLEGLGRKHADAADIGSGGAGPVIESTPGARPGAVPMPPPMEKPRPAPLPIEAWDAFVAGDPLSDPRAVAAVPAGFAPSMPPEVKPVPGFTPAPAQKANPPAQATPKRAKTGGSIDLDALLEKGLISPEEHAKLSQLGERL